MKRTLQDYKSVIKPVWCPGCGDYGVLQALQKALLELEIPPEEVIAVSGIGCSGRLSHFVNSYSLHGTHGRAVPTAIGAKTARPDLTVLAMGGDGDGLGIGGGHISHAARKNVDITYLLIDNRIYGLTKGQTSPTSPLGQRTKTSPFGAFEDPLEPLPIFLSYDITFIARANGVDVKEMQHIIMEGIKHKGMSIIYIQTPCKTFPVLDAKAMKELFQPIPDDHPRDNKLKAMELAYSQKPLYTGIYYQVERSSLEERLQDVIKSACKKENDGKICSVEQILLSYA
ncbi:thiamine pyrophosphate-dependent enzyme [Bacteroidota bacterium]